MLVHHSRAKSHAPSQGVSIESPAACATSSAIQQRCLGPGWYMGAVDTDMYLTIIVI